MREYYAEFAVTFDAKDIDERDEILARLKAALQNTEWKVRAVDCIHCEEA